MCTGDKGDDVRINKIAFLNGRKTCDGRVIVSGTDGSVEVSHGHQDQQRGGSDQLGTNVNHDFIALAHSIDFTGKVLPMIHIRAYCTEARREISNYMLRWRTNGLKVKGKKVGGYSVKDSLSSRTIS